MKLQLVLDKLLKDKQGRIVIAQLPNLPLFIFILSSLLLMAYRKGTPGYLFKVVSFGSLFTWCWLEIFNGTNYFRRILGGVVLVMSIISAIAYLRSL
jgi:hypothetical protein